MDYQGVKPWHLWGSNATVNILANGATPLSYSSQQLARIDYKRPDTWRFFFAATLLDIQGPVLAGALVTVDFAVSFGVGRSMKTIENFVHFSFDPPFVLPVNKWAGSSIEPSRTPLATQQIITEIPAESIQCNAKVLLQAGSAADYTAVVAVDAFFSPIQHIRPDWFSPEKDERFNGERRGR